MSRRAVVSHPRGRLAAWAPGLSLLLLLGACAGPEATGEPTTEEGGAAPPAALVGTVGPEGGELAGAVGSPFEGFRLVVPPGALAAATELRVEGTQDPLPLSPQATRVGPQYALLPAGRAFAVPVRVTVPFDPQLRGALDVADADCKAWYRTDTGWAKADAVASDSGGVTVELSATTALAAGAFLPLRTFDCMGCTAAPSTTTCLGGDQYCLRKLGTLSTEPAGRVSYWQGILHWPTLTGSGLALAGFDVLQQREEPLTAAVDLSGNPVFHGTHDVIVDGAGAHWFTLPFFGTIKYDGQRLPQVFDFSTTLEPVGIGYDVTTREVLRFRGKKGLSPYELSVVKGGLTLRIGVLENTSRVRGVVQVGRGLASPTQSPFWLDTAYNGMRRVVVAQAPNKRHPKEGPCEDELATEYAASSDGLGLSYGCTNSTAGTWTLGYVGGPMATASSTARSVTRRVFEVESRGNVYSSPTEAPEILRYGKDGSFTRIGLVPQGTTGEDYQAMVPLALHYERGLDVFYVVTRGRNHRPDVYELSHLP